MRDTAVVQRALFESAPQQIIPAGFSLAMGSTIIEPLHRVMKTRAIDVRLLVRVEQVRRADVDAAAKAATANRRVHAGCVAARRSDLAFHFDKRALTTSRGPAST